MMDAPPPADKRGAAVSNRPAWPDDEDGAQDRGFKRLSAEEARALSKLDPPLSPWRVVSVQAVVGVGVALLCGGLFGDWTVFGSALYGAGVVVIPAVLMARGMTSRLSSVNPGVSAVSFMLWEFVKIGVSVGLLLAAPRVMVPLSWPALLVGLVACIKVYWVALLWRGRRQ